jgi:hypothetical protein
MSTKSPKKKARTAAIERHTLITLSTAHVPESLATADEVAARAAIMDGLALATGEHGWLVNVDRDLSTVKEPGSIVDALREILWWAKKRGADYVLFDADGPVIERFAVYDW